MAPVRSPSPAATLPEATVETALFSPQTLANLEVPGIPLLYSPWNKLKDIADLGLLKCFPLFTGEFNSVLHPGNTSTCCKSFAKSKK